MTKLLVVVDMQNDFIDGALGTKEAQSIVGNVVKKINSWNGNIIATLDTHYEDYLTTNEGKHLPVEHCIVGSDGHELNKDIHNALLNGSGKLMLVEKPSFGSTSLPNLIDDQEVDYIEIVGLCTDICVVSNALMLKAFHPEIKIVVDPSCCAGVTPELHRAALDVMKSCQIDILNAED